jgi:hypothetical protein
MEANAALRSIMRRDSGESYREMLTRMAKESGVETPTIDDLVRLDRKRKGKKLSNEDWVSKTDPDAKIAKMKDGSTHLAYKPEHAVDLRHGRHCGGADPWRRRGRHGDARPNACGGGKEPRCSWLRADARRSLRSRGRQGLSFTRCAERPRRQPMEDAHRRAPAE